MAILFVFFGAVALVAVITLTLFRFVTRSLGLSQVVADGVVLTENGLEFLGFLGLGKMKASYVDVESVESLSFLKGLISIPLFRFGMSSHWICTRPFHEIVIIKLKGRRAFKYLLSTPKNTSTFVEQLKSRMAQTRGSLAQI